MSTKRALCGTIGLWTMLAGAPGLAQQVCGPPMEHNQFRRPLDYNDPVDREWLDVVERAHFTAEIEALIRGKNVPLPGDIDYTLMQYPNHYRALHAMARWQLANRRPPDAEYLTVDCYYQRAFTFRPKDPTLYMLYGIYLHKAGRLDDAWAAYQRAEAHGANSAEYHYNMGLLQIDRQDYEDARKHARIAYELGYPLPGLRNKLRRLGHW